jgi:circadian clock protein KaiC
MPTRETQRHAKAESEETPAATAAGHASTAGAKAHVPAPVLATGISGLDDVLNGGWPEHRLYLVEGAPGAGKTTLALQFLLEGRRVGEGALYVTLSETRQELDEVAESHGWTLDGITTLDTTEATAAAGSGTEAQYTVFHPSEVELQTTIQTILETVDRVRPTRVVLDSLSDMRLLARDPLRFRRQILAIKQVFAQRHITALLLDDQTADQPDMQLQSLVHGVLRLEHIPLLHGAERRQLRVTKLRAVRFHAGYHDFVIRTGGLEVFPRIRLGGDRKFHEFPVLCSGSPELDALTGGGIPPGTAVLVTGAPGTGKSVLAAQYAAAAAASGERVAVYVFDERIGTFKQRARTLGLGLEEPMRDGRVQVTQLEPTQISPGEFTNRICKAVDAGVALVVIDSLNGFTQAMAQEHEVTLKVHELLSYLGGRGVTTLVTLAQHGVFGSTPDSNTDVSYLADTVVLMRYFEAQGEVRRAISVLKQRTGDHERTIREFRVGRGGLALGEPLREFQGVLTGVPTFSGAGRELLESRSAAEVASPRTVV